MIYLQRCLTILLFPVLLALAPLSASMAQQPADGGGTNIDRERASQLIETLQDDESRAALIEQLKLLSQAEDRRIPPYGRLAEGTNVIDQMGSGTVDLVAREIALIRDRLGDIVASLTDLPNFLHWLRLQLEQSSVRSAIFQGVIGLLFTIGAGWLAAWGATKLTSGVWPQRDGDEGRDLANVVMRAIGRIVLAAFSLAVFAGVSNTALVFLSDGTIVRQIAVGLILTISIRQVVIFIISELARPRYLRLDKQECLVLSRWLQRIATIMIFGYFLVTTMSVLGLPGELSGVVSNLFGLIVLVMALRLIFTTGDTVTNALGKATGPLSLIARVLVPVWVLLASVYATTLFIIWSLGVDQFSSFALASLASVGVIALALVVDVLLQRLNTAHEFASESGPGAVAVCEGPKPAGFVGPGQPQQPQKLHGVAHTTLERARWPFRLLTAAIALLIVAQFWGLDVIGWAQAAQGQALIATLMNIALVCIIALVIWDVTRRGIESWLSAPETGVSAAKRTQRVRTLLPLLRTGLGIVLGTVVVLAILAELGINIAPLLAGAGVVGLAIGFGSQALVKDVISGAFMLAENTLSVGDVVRLGSHAGVVEALTIRSVRLRDLSGTVHTIPLGEITAVENMTKDFSFYVMDIGVSYGADVDQVIEVIKELGAGLRDDPELGWDMLEPLEVLGVDQFADSAVIIKARIKTVPLRQWAVGREFNRRMKNRFDELGISIPFPQVTVSYLAPNDEAKAEAAAKPEAQAAPDTAEIPATDAPAPADADAEIGEALEEKAGKPA